jgi:hypothetical protein
LSITSNEERRKHAGLISLPFGGKTRSQAAGVPMENPSKQAGGVKEDDAREEYEDGCATRTTRGSDEEGIARVRRVYACDSIPFSSMRRSEEGKASGLTFLSSSFSLFLGCRRIYHAFAVKA